MLIFPAALSLYPTPARHLLARRWILRFLMILMQRRELPVTSHLYNRNAFELVPQIQALDSTTEETEARFFNSILRNEISKRQ